jgi:hypothetical protein
MPTDVGTVTSITNSTAHAAAPVLAFVAITSSGSGVAVPLVFQSSITFSSVGVVDAPPVVIFDVGVVTAATLSSVLISKFVIAVNLPIPEDISYTTGGPSRLLDLTLNPTVDNLLGLSTAPLLPQPVVTLTNPIGVGG